MSRARWIAGALLAVIVLVAAGASFLAPAPYAKQFRSDADHPPSRQYM